MQKKRDQRTFFLFLLCWLVFFTSYLGKRNFSAALAEMKATGFLDLSQGGVVHTIFFLTYGFGQLVNGFLADRRDPAGMIRTGLILASLSNLVMGLTRVYFWMPIAWAVNGYALSMLWTPILRIFSREMEGRERENYTVHMSSSVAAGGLASYALSAAMIYLGGWRWSFLAAAICLGVCAVSWMVFSPRLLIGSGAVAGKKEIPTLSWKQLLCSPLVLWCLFPVVMHGVLRDGVSGFVPSYVEDTFPVTPAAAVLLSTALPFVNLAGPYLAHFVNRRLFRNEIATAGFFFTGAAAFLAYLAAFGTGSLGGSLASLCVITTLIEGVNVMMVSLIPLRFSAVGRAATLSGFFNCMTYVGTAISTYTGGYLVEGMGWRPAIWVWAACAAVGVGICLVGSRLSKKA